MCWTLGITEHHNGVDNVLALINLSLLCGHVGRWGAGLNPLRGQNNVQGGGDMGALPNKLPGFQDVVDPVARAKFDAAWGGTIPPDNGWHLTEMFEAMERGELRALFVIGENPAQSEADVDHAIELLATSTTSSCRTSSSPRPPSSPTSCSPGRRRGARRTERSPTPSVGCSASARRSTHPATRVTTSRSCSPSPPTSDTSGPTDPRGDLGRAALAVADARRDVVRRLDELGGIQWPCYSEDRLEPSFLHGRLWADDPAERGRLAPFSVVIDDPPVELLDDEFPLRLTTGRRLDSYNTGVQSGGYQSPLRFGETIDVSPEDADGCTRRGRDGPCASHGVAPSRRRSASTPRCGPDWCS